MAIDMTSPAGGTGTPAWPRARAEAGLSIVVPLFNEADSLPALHARISEVARRLKDSRRLAAEVIYVDDGSRDATLSIARGLPSDALDVQVVSLSRNFGKEAALLAGLDHGRFGAILFMDGDGQHPASLVETLVGHWLDQGYDVVYTAKAHRVNESWLRRIGVHTFYAVIGARVRRFRRMQAISGCCPRGLRRRCGNCPSATGSSRAWRAGSDSARSASTMSPNGAHMDAARGICIPCSACRSKG
jgi:polyisoprenyl-phosphate glycosyltransferase